MGVHRHHFFRQGIGADKCEKADADLTEGRQVIQIVFWKQEL